jgi:hypothetical protein
MPTADLEIDTAVMSPVDAARRIADTFKLPRL